VNVIVQYVDLLVTLKVCEGVEYLTSIADEIIMQSPVCMCKRKSSYSYFDSSHIQFQSFANYIRTRSSKQSTSPLPSVLALFRACVSMPKKLYAGHVGTASRPPLMPLSSMASYKSFLAMLLLTDVLISHRASTGLLDLFRWAYSDSK
jgi:hypothetical protein